MMVTSLAAVLILQIRMSVQGAAKTYVGLLPQGQQGHAPSEARSVAFADALALACAARVEASAEATQEEEDQGATVASPAASLV